jgi:hypothetical protein
MSYSKIKKQIPEDANVGPHKRIPASFYFDHVVDKLMRRDLGNKADIMCIDERSSEYLKNLDISTVVEKLEETVNMEIHPRGWNFIDSQVAYASRTESKSKAQGLLRILRGI